MTGNVFQVLNVLNPRWWLPQMLNQALDTDRFHQQHFRSLAIDLWANRPKYPRELLPWDEGSTQVDATIRWQNPPTTVFIEAKYGSDLSSSTAGDNGGHGYPSDQLIRNIRVGLWECGYFRAPGLFESPRREFAVILFSPRVGHPLVAKYRQLDTLLTSIPHSDQLTGLPTQPFVGEFGYEDLSRLLKRQRRWFTKPERLLLDTLTRYLQFKIERVPENRPTFGNRQRLVPLMAAGEGAQ